MVDYGVIASTPELAFENYQVLSLTQAMFGLVRPSLAAAFLRCDGERVRIRFVLDSDGPDEREALDDIAFEFEALQCTIIDLHVDTEVSDGRHLVMRDGERGVYARWTE